MSLLMGPAIHERVAEPQAKESLHRRKTRLRDLSVVLRSSAEQHIPSIGNHFLQTVCPAQVTKREGPALEQATPKGQPSAMTCAPP